MDGPQHTHKEDSRLFTPASYVAYDKYDRRSMNHFYHWSTNVTSTIHSTCNVHVEG